MKTWNINYDKQNKANPYQYIAKRKSDNKRICGPVIEINNAPHILQKKEDNPNEYIPITIRERTLRKSTQKERIRFLLEHLKPGERIRITNKETGKITILNAGDKLPRNLYPHKQTHLIRLVQMDVYRPEMKQEKLYETNYPAKRMIKAYEKTCRTYFQTKMESEKPLTPTDLLLQFGAITRRLLRKPKHKITIEKETGRLLVPENIAADIIMRFIAYSMPKDFEYKPVQKTEIPENLIIAAEHESYKVIDPYAKK